MSRYKIFRHYSLDTDINLTHRVISNRLFFEIYFKHIYIYIDTLEKHFPPSFFFLLIRGKRKTRWDKVALKQEYTEIMNFDVTRCNAWQR